MRIAIIVSTFPPYKGGIGNTAHSEAVELGRRGHKVTVYTPKYAKTYSNGVVGFNLHRLTPFLRYGNSAFLPQLFWKLKDFDVVHLHYPFFGGAEVVWVWIFLNFLRKSRRTRPRVVITYHHDVVGKGFLSKFFKWHTRYLMPRILKRADKIIVSSFDYAKNSNIKNIFASQPEKFSEIPFGIDATKFKSAAKDEEFLKKYGLSLNDKIILFVGGLDRAHYFKGLENLINSKFQIPNSKLLIVGDGDLKTYYQKKARDLKISDDVIFAGSVADGKLPRYYNLADLVVLPSVDGSEAFGIALIEAASCGKAVVASNLPGVRSVVDNGVNGLLIKPGDADDLAEKINYLLERPDLLKQFGENGRKKVLEKYDVQEISGKLEEILCN